MAKVSVIVPVYKVEAYVERCVRSLMEQTLDDMEFVFVDDCSPDRSIEIVKRVVAEYPQRAGQVKIISHEKNRGVAAARNTGLENAAGDFIGFCDADDWVDTCMFKALYEVAYEHGAEVACCEFMLHYPDSVERVATRIEEGDKIDMLKDFFKNRDASLCNKLVSKNVIERSNLRFVEGINFSEDLYGACVLLCYAKKIKVVKAPYYHYFFANNDSISRNPERLRKNLSEELVYFNETYKAIRNLAIFDSIKEIFFHKALICKRCNLLRDRDVKKYLSVMPESRDYIFSNPYDSVWIRLITWGIIRIGSLFYRSK